MSRTKKIDTLTPEQEQALVAYREEWLAWGRCCDPADRPAAEAVLRAMYQALGESVPHIWWCDGPAVGSLVRTVLKHGQAANLGANLRDNLGANLGANLRANLRDNLGANLGANLRDNLGDNLWDNLGDNLGDNLWDDLGANLRDNLGDNLGDNLWDDLGANLRDNLRDNLWANLRDNLGANLRDNLRDNLWANLRDNLGANLRDNLWANLSWYCWGQHEVYWPCFYDFPDRHLRAMHTPQQRERLGWWLTLGKSCGWWMPFKGIVFICERPLRQAVDGQGRLHHETGPALLCRDGWPVYAWHGVRVSADLIERPETITIQQIQQEANAEIRRVQLERFGFDRYIQDSGALPIHADETGTLYRCELSEDEPLVMVRVTNRTPEADGSYKHYILRVPPDMTQARQAVAWTFGKTPEQYHPAVES